jgi:asparagine synthetase B (glutamine-hydrolysing)
MPFLSRPIIDFSLRIPVRHKTSILRQKIVLREALGPLIPKEISERGKAIQRAKRTSELSDVLDTMADQLLSPGDVSERGLIDPGYVTGIRQRPKDGIYSGDQLSRLWMLITTELWCRTFIDNRGAPYGFSQTSDLRASTPPPINDSDSY